MRTVSATQAKQRFAALIDAAQRAPVRIQRHERDVAVLLSAEEYERLQMKDSDETTPDAGRNLSAFRSFLDALASQSSDAEHLRGQSFDREAIYGDHD